MNNPMILVVEDDDVLAALPEAVGQLRADEPGRPGDQDFHSDPP